MRHLKVFMPKGLGLDVALINQCFASVELLLMGLRDKIKPANQFRKTIDAGGLTAASTLNCVIPNSYKSLW